MSRSLRLPSWLSPPQPEVAIEIAHRRVTVAQIGRGARPAVSGYATESLPDDAVVPSLTARNIANPRAISEALKRALDRAGIKSPSRVALIVPDTVARVSLLPFEQMPARQGELEQLIRWQVKKSVPFPVDDAVLSYVPAATDAGITTLAAVVSRRDVIAEYEAVADAIGAHAGIVDIASFNVINTVLAAGLAPDADWLLVCLAADSTTIVIMRGSSLVFHRHRPAADSEPLNALVHQTAMYHEDRLGGTKFARVFLSGGTSGDIAGGHERARKEIAERLGTTVETLDPRAAATLNDRISAGAELLDALAAPVGALLRERGVA
jgi:type IV pilus assembly protein PilM